MTKRVRDRHAVTLRPPVMSFHGAGGDGSGNVRGLAARVGPPAPPAAAA
jgi:hypothetical protein